MRSVRSLTVLFSFALASGCADRPGAAPAGTPVAWRDSMVQRAGGPRLHFAIAGTGADTVIVLSGGPGVPAVYLRPLLDGLIEGRTFVTIEPRGFGESDGWLVPDSMSIGKLAEDVRSVMDSLRIGHAAILAHHFGAMLAERVAHAETSRITRMVVLAPLYPRARYQFTIRRGTEFVQPPQGLTRLYEDSVLQKDPARFCREAWPVFFGPDTYWEPRVVQEVGGALCSAPPAALKGVLDEKRPIVTAMGDWEWRDSLRQLQLPVLGIQGTQLDPSYLHGARNWIRYVPQGRILEVQASHLFPWIAQRGSVIAAADRFLRGDWPADAVVPPLLLVVGPEDSLPPPGADSASLASAKAEAKRIAARGGRVTKS